MAIIRGRSQKLFTTLSLSAMYSVLSACATPPNQAAMELAGLGDEATLSMQEQLTRVAAMTSGQTELGAFTNTLSRCANENLTCKPVLPSERLVTARTEFTALAGLRIDALGELNNAYSALYAEASYDASGDLSTAVKGLTGAANEYSIAAGLGAFAATSVFDKLLPQAAGLLAGNRQHERLMAANEIIGAASKRMSDSLAKEHDIYRGLLQDWTKTEERAREGLRANGLISRADILAPLASRVGSPIRADSDRIIDGNVHLQTAIDAMLLTRGDQRAQAADAAYVAAVEALAALASAHTAFAANEMSDEQAILNALRALNQAMDGISDLR